MSKTSDRQVVEFIREFRDERGYCPTFREVASGVGVALNSVAVRLERMRREGLVDYADKQPRTLRELV